MRRINTLNDLHEVLTFNHTIAEGPGAAFSNVWPVPIRIIDREGHVFTWDSAHLISDPADGGNDVAGQATGRRTKDSVMIVDCETGGVRTFRIEDILTLEAGILPQRPF